MVLGPGFACPAGFEYSHRGGISNVDGRDIDPGKEMSVHAVDPGQVVELSRVVKQPAGLIGDKIAIHHRSEFKEVHDHTCRTGMDSDLQQFNEDRLYLHTLPI